jgi:hypothetical protein
MARECIAEKPSLPSGREGTRREFPSWLLLKTNLSLFSPVGGRKVGRRGPG